MHTQSPNKHSNSVALWTWHWNEGYCDLLHKLGKHIVDGSFMNTDLWIWRIAVKLILSTVRQWRREMNYTIEIIHGQLWCFAMCNMTLCKARMSLVQEWKVSYLNWIYHEIEIHYMQRLRKKKARTLIFYSQK